MSTGRPPRNSYRTGPDERGHFGIYGGRFVAETLMPLILDLERAYAYARADPSFQAEMDGHLATYVGRPSPLYFAERLTQHCGGAKIYFKREELNHTGAHKVNNVLGQIMLALRMGKTRIIAETGAGMHGVATATLCAKFGLPCIVYMGAVDVERQKPNVLRMKSVGADVDGAEHDAVRGEHAAGLVAAVIAATEADAEAEAVAPVVVMMEGRPDEAARRSGGRGQRHGAK
jgi:tryptophan synthase beta chain